MGKGSSGNVLAALASFFIPGLGQLVQARIAAAAFFFGTVMLMFFLVIFGVVNVFMWPLVITWPLAWFVLTTWLLALPLGLLFHLWAIINDNEFPTIWLLVITWPLAWLVLTTWPIALPLGLLFHLWAIIDAAKFTPKKSDDKLI